MPDRSRDVELRSRWILEAIVDTHDVPREALKAILGCATPTIDELIRKAE